MHSAVIFIGGEINPPLAQHQRLFQFGEQEHASAGRVERRDQQPVIPPGIRAGDGAAGKAAQPVGFQPLPAERSLQVAADRLVKADHLQG